MRDRAQVLAVFLAAIVLVSSACSGGESESVAAQAKTGPQTVKGQVICLVCYGRNHANTREDHDSGRVCAQACVKWEGNPVGLVTIDGKVYQFAGGLVANNNEKAAQHVAQTVSVTGEVYEKDGMTMIRADDMEPVQQ